MERIIILFLFATLLISCDEEIQVSRLVYENDFENNLTEEVAGASSHTFAGSKMSGYYNKGGFSVYLKDLDDHKYVQISFDLYIHDTWDGNVRGIGGPDLWMLQLDEWGELSVLSQTLIFKTTFSNSSCSSTYCLNQSYPFNFPHTNDPKSGSIEILPGLCDPSDSTKITSHYKIEKIFPHKDEKMAVRFSDQLRQGNAKDEACDESWSLDNLAIRIF